MANWWSEANKATREAADRRYTLLCRLNALDRDAEAATVTPRRPVTPAAVTPKPTVTRPTVTRPTARKVEAESPVIVLPRPGPGGIERRYLSWYTGGSDDR